MLFAHSCGWDPTPGWIYNFWGLYICYIPVKEKTMEKHGHAPRKGPSAEWRSWRAMKTRCTNAHSSDYKNYGGRGITVCPRWLHSFQNFLSDMGLKPTAKHTLDRINNDGNYEPKNCRWATAKEQRDNRRPLTLRATCGRGHPFVEENIYWVKRGSSYIRACKTCSAEWKRLKRHGIPRPAGTALPDGTVTNGGFTSVTYP